MEAPQSKNEVFIEEFFDARIDRVFEAWTNPEKLIKWYAPEGCTVHFKTINIKAGGQFHMRISNPQFGDCWSIGEYKEIIRNSKIVFSLINANEHGNPINPADVGMDPDWLGATLVSVTLTEHNGKTKLQLQQTVSQALATKTGAYPSWLQMLNNMKRLVTQPE